MDVYFRTNYSRCNQNVSFLASKQFLETACHTGSCFMLVISFYALFLIVRKSSASMKSLVPYMVNLQIWTILCDFSFAVLFLPYYMLPMIAGNGMGLLLWFNVPPKVQIYIAMASLAGMFSAVMTLFEERHRTIVTDSIFVIRKKSLRIIMNIVIYGISVNAASFVIVTWPDDQEQAKLEQLKIVPCPPPLFFHENTYVLQVNGMFWLPIMLLSCVYFACVIGFYNIHTSWYLLPRNNPSMSAATKKIQMKFQVANLIQVSIPLFVVLLPNLYWNVSIAAKFHIQELNNISVFFFTLHGISASLAIIVLYAPYRNYTKQLIFEKVLRINVAKTSTVVSTSGNQNSMRSVQGTNIEPIWLRAKTINCFPCH